MAHPYNMTAVGMAAEPRAVGLVETPLTTRLLKQLIEAGDRLTQARSRIEAEIERLAGPYPVSPCGPDGPSAPGDLYHIEAHVAGLFSTADRLAAAADRLASI